jgi:urease accessory protein
VELGIALSVVVLGGVVALAVRAPVAAAMGVVAFFAVFHGHAHGAEMPENATGLAYGVGFMIATALLHTSGVGMGLLIGRAGNGYGTAIVRSAGGLAAIAGIAVLTGIL